MLGAGWGQDCSIDYIFLWDETLIGFLSCIEFMVLMAVHDVMGEISPKAIFVWDWLWIRRLLQLNPRGIYILLFHSLIIVCTVGIKHRSCGTLHKSAGSLWLPGAMRPYDDIVHLPLAWLYSWTGNFKLHTFHVFLFSLLLLLLLLLLLFD